MNSVLAEIYASVLPSAPFVIAAYALIWLVLCGYVVSLLTRLRKAELHLQVLEEELSHKKEQEKASSSL